VEPKNERIVDGPVVGRLGLLLAYFHDALSVERLDDGQLRADVLLSLLDLLARLLVAVDFFTRTRLGKLWVRELVVDELVDELLEVLHLLVQAYIVWGFHEVGSVEVGEVCRQHVASFVVVHGGSRCLSRCWC